MNICFSTLRPDSRMILSAHGGGDKRDILRDLFYGNYAAFERIFARDSEQAKALGIVVDLEKKLKKVLPAELQILFKLYDDAVADLASVSNIDSFVEGYQLGVNLILAAFPEHVERLKGMLAKFTE